MIVVDASVVLATLLDRGEVGRETRATIGKHRHAVAPELVHVEVASAARRHAAFGRISDESARAALVQLPDLVECVSHRGLTLRAWELRENVSPYDAVYVALAELLELPLLTGDAKLARATGPRCERELISTQLA